jgi:hypothetical protein
MGKLARLFGGNGAITAPTNDTSIIKMLGSAVKKFSLTTPYTIQQKAEDEQRIFNIESAAERVKSATKEVKAKTGFEKARGEFIEATGKYGQAVGECLVEQNAQQAGLYKVAGKVAESTVKLADSRKEYEEKRQAAILAIKNSNNVGAFN